jgi:hypothetical protein
MRQVHATYMGYSNTMRWVLGSGFTWFVRKILYTMVGGEKALPSVCLLGGGDERERKSVVE